MLKKDITSKKTKSNLVVKFRIDTFDNNGDSNIATNIYVYQRTDTKC